MNKSVLVIDTPKNCDECRLCYHEYYISHEETYCQLHKSGTFIAVDKNTKPDWCPLSPIPERINLKQYVDNAARNIDSVLTHQYAQGWNSFREEILKGEE